MRLAPKINRAACRSCLGNYFFFDFMAFGFLVELPETFSLLLGWDFILKAEGFWVPLPFLLRVSVS